jgi:23S rRNA (guanine1835-N2)-methyltransferase
MPNLFKIPVGLSRNPINHHQLLAWDSADVLVLEHLSTLDLKDKKILILNDRFGAIALPLRAFAPCVYTDSYLSDQAIGRNEEQLGQSHADELTAEPVLRIHDLEKIHGHFDFVVLRLPKNNRFLEDILSHLVRVLRPSSQLICATMVKHQSRGAIELLKK